MDAKLQRRVQRYGWDRAASIYEAHWSRNIEPAQTLLLELAELQPGERVLDVACGTGLVTFAAVAAVGPAGAVTGTDISEAMIDVARAEADRRGLANVSFARMDAEALAPDLGVFDAALCSLGLMYVPDPVTSLRAMRALVRPGGRVVSAVWGARDRCGWAGIFPVVDARVHSEVCPLFFRLGTGDALARTCETAGLGQVTSRRISTVMRHESDDDACGAAFAGGPVALAYSRFDPDTRRAAREAYLETIASYRVGAGYEIPGEFVVARGTV